MLGNTLKQAREKLDLPLREIEWATKIKAEYLEALEAEDFAALPAPVYIRGFLRTYAQYLSVDPEPLIAEYNSRDASATEVISTRPAVRPDRVRFTITPAMVVAVVMLALLAVFLVYVKGAFDRYQASLAAAGSAPTELHFSPAPTPTVSPSPSPSPEPVRGVIVVVRVEQRSWIKVLVDGQPSPQTTSAGLVYPDGTILSFKGDRSVRVISGRAGHTFITVNGQDMGAMKNNDGVGDETYNAAVPDSPRPSP
ncbi:MAG: hypothetical protein QOE92_2135 [Chloroflexota bacterium]|nr:hypothetical protein [Chloroflexota bacterium]